MTDYTMAFDEACTCFRATRFVFTVLDLSYPNNDLTLIPTPAQDEKDRMDIYHKIMEVARHGALHQAPIYNNPLDPPRILDLGCGTGIWAIDMAE